MIKDGLDKLEISYNNDQIDKLWKYKNLLIKENKKYNLTNITDEKEIIKKHFLDSLAPLAEINIPDSFKILDLGTGAGFPAMVWKIFLEKNDFLLIDSTLKKVNFLKLLSAKLETYDNLEIVHGRAEDLGQNSEYREKYDLVLTRAVASLNILSEYTLAFAKKGSLLYYYKGPDYIEEKKNSDKAFKTLGAKFVEAKKIRVPGLEAERYLLIYKKSKKTPSKYPRRAGIPKKRPL